MTTRRRTKEHMPRSREARDAAMDGGCDTLTVDLQVQYGVGREQDCRRCNADNGRTDEMHWLSDTKLVSCLVTWSASPTNRILRRGQGARREGGRGDIRKFTMEAQIFPNCGPRRPVPASPAQSGKRGCIALWKESQLYYDTLHILVHELHSSVIQQMSFKLAVPPTQLCVEYSY